MKCRNIKRCRHQRAKIERMEAKQRPENNQRERREGTATSLSVESEHKVVAWINERRKDGIPVSLTMLRVRAIEIAEETEVDGFLESWSCCHAFMHHPKLSIRARTRQGLVTTGEAEAAIHSFRELVLHTKERLGISKVYKADQTAICFEYLPKHTISARGTKTVWVRYAGKNKEWLTAMLFGDSDGNKYLPFVVVKSRRSKNDDQQAENDIHCRRFGRRMWCDILHTPDLSHLQIYGNTKGGETSDLPAASEVDLRAPRSDQEQRQSRRATTI
uniref:Uncharacterized protein AlNc14C213G8968 n=1 Tax=Albugo laibachii Nc14 TaxID=890382 RepID=F0WRG5_9STRA|nr:conserved hypothetical protein [Albugo laibachii Nc14]|eukprot:CCA23928.1 conserved hypothetical protein [Albugo laibachii Nc14]